MNKIFNKHLNKDSNTVFVFATHIPFRTQCSILNSYFEILHIDNKKNNVMYLQSLTGKILLKYAALTQFNLPFLDIFDKQCKPYAKDNYSLEFNISHSGEWVLCALASKEVGIDVQLIKPQFFHTSERFFSKQEIEWLLSAPKKHQVNYFTELWTLKESYTKCVGLGLYIPFNSFSIIKENDEICLFFKSTKICTFSFYSNRLNNKYIFSICLRGSHIEKVVFKEVQIEELIRWITIENGE